MTKEKGQFEILNQTTEMTAHALLLATLSLCFVQLIAAQTNTGYQYLDFELEVHRLANEARASNSLPPLFLDKHLAAAARAHSLDMKENNYFNHTGQDGSTCVNN